MRRRLAFLTIAVIAIACSSSDPEGGTSPGTESPDTPASTTTTTAADGGPAPTSKDSGGAPAVDAGHDTGTDAALGPDFTGQATYYDADGTGSCGFPATTNFLVAAMNDEQYVKKTSCGQCVFVTGPNGSVTVRIVDLCPGCAFGGLDLSETAFKQIAALSAGRVAITWHQVACP